MQHSHPVSRLAWRSSTLLNLGLGLCFSLGLSLPAALADDIEIYIGAMANDVETPCKATIALTKKRETTLVAPSVRVSESNQLLHDNKLYYAIFSPSHWQNWPGNLKKYAISHGIVVGKSGAAAIDSQTGFFAAGEGDLWSTSATHNDEAEVGGARDKNATIALRQVYTDVDGFGLIAHADGSPITPELLGIAERPDQATRYQQLINWLLAKDATGGSAYQLGDPLHSKPVVQRCASTANTVFFGTNQGFIHAINAVTGVEKYAFIPAELLGNVNAYYENNRLEDAGRRYGMDGPLTLIKLQGKELLIAGMRRGGRSYYALDISSEVPQLAWRLTPESASAFSPLGQSWSRMIPATVSWSGTTRQVLFFAGGYNPAQDDKELRSSDSSGNAIYMIDAASGSLLWYASNKALGGSAAHAVIAEMNYAIPANLYVLDRDRDGLSDHIYAVDMGGQVLRFDIHHGVSGSGFISGGVVADMAGSSVESNHRRFFHSPDVAYVNDRFGQYFAIAVGSGYRAHPLNKTIVDRFYLLRDKGVFSVSHKASGQLRYAHHKAVEAELLDVTNVLSGEDVSGLNSAELARYAKGFYVRLTTPGEKVLSSPVIANHQVTFTTYYPEEPGSSEVICAPPEGHGRLYLMSLSDGLPPTDPNNNNPSASDRWSELHHAGIPSSPSIIYSEQDLPIICVSGECTNASALYDEHGNPILDESVTGDKPMPINALLPPANRVYRDSSWSSHKEQVPE